MVNTEIKNIEYQDPLEKLDHDPDTMYILKRHWKRFFQEKKYFEYNWDLYMAKYLHLKNMEHNQRNDYINAGIKKDGKPGIIKLFRHLKWELEDEEFVKTELERDSRAEPEIFSDIIHEKKYNFRLTRKNLREIHDVESLVSKPTIVSHNLVGYEDKNKDLEKFLQYTSYL